MKTIPNWKRVAMRSHSMWAQYLALVCLVAPELAFVTLGYDVASPRLWWSLGVVLSIYGVIGRIVNQGLVR